MPKIYEYKGYAFFFYSNEHEPIHCHVKQDKIEMKFELIELAGKLHIRPYPISKKEFTSKEKSEIERFIRKYKHGIISRWNQYFNEGEKPNCDKIQGKV